jgi:hypothetical protein
MTFGALLLQQVAQAAECPFKKETGQRLFTRDGDWEKTYSPTATACDFEGISSNLYIRN